MMTPALMQKRCRSCGQDGLCQHLPNIGWLCRECWPPTQAPPAPTPITAEAERLNLVKLNIEIAIEGPEGMDQFARMLRVLFDNGYEAHVREIVRQFIAAVEEQGIQAPAGLKEFALMKFKLCRKTDPPEAAEMEAESQGQAEAEFREMLLTWADEVELDTNCEEKDADQH